MRAYPMLVMLFMTTLATLSGAQNIVIPNADTLSVQQKRPFGMGVTLLGPAVVGSVSASYYIRDYLKAEVGVGLIGYFAGATLHYRNDNFKDNWTAYAGAYFSHTAIIFGPKDQENAIYCPIGMQFLSDKGFGFAPEIAYRYSPVLHRNLWGALKFSYQF